MIRAVSGLDDADLERLVRRGKIGDWWRKITGKGGDKYKPLSSNTPAEQREEDKRKDAEVRN